MMYCLYINYSLFILSILKTLVKIMTVRIISGFTSANHVQCW